MEKEGIFRNRNGIPLVSHTTGVLTILDSTSINGIYYVDSSGAVSLLEEFEECFENRSIKDPIGLLDRFISFNMNIDLVSLYVILKMIEDKHKYTFYSYSGLEKVMELTKPCTSSVSISNGISIKYRHGFDKGNEKNDNHKIKIISVLSRVMLNKLFDKNMWSYDIYYMYASFDQFKKDRDGTRASAEVSAFVNYIVSCSELFDYIFIPFHRDILDELKSKGIPFAAVVPASINSEYLLESIYDNTIYRHSDLEWYISPEFMRVIRLTYQDALNLHVPLRLLDDNCPNLSLYDCIQLNEQQDNNYIPWAIQ